MIRAYLFALDPTDAQTEAMRCQTGTCLRVRQLDCCGKSLALNAATAR